MIDIEVIMNPTRQRIIQHLILNKKGTASDIHEALTDIPLATLYRHIKLLIEASCLEVVEEKRIRGTVEKTYALIQKPMWATNNKESISYLIQSSLLNIMATFQKYFVRDEVDPMKDMISLSTSTLLLSEEEFKEMTHQIGEVLNQYIENTPTKERRTRSITFISSPIEE